MIKGLGSVLAEKNHPVVWIVNGASFVGSFLAEKLLAKKCIVVVIDNWTAGVQENLTHLTGEKKFQVLDIDITAPPPAGRAGLPEILPPNYIFYLERTRDDAPENAVPVLKELSRGVEQLLEIATRTRAKFLFAYSSYKNEHSRASGVEFAKSLVDEFTKTKNLDGRTVCLGDPYGPRMILIARDPISEVFRNILYNRELPQSASKVSPVFVTDAANGLLLAMFGANTRGKTFSFGTDEMTLSEFGEKAHGAARFTTTSIVNELSLDLLSLRIERNVLPVLTPVEIGSAKTIRFFREHLTRTRRADAPTPSSVRKKN